MTCRHKFINCLPQEDCFISCNDNESCLGSVINCPIAGDCIIECHGIASCHETIIDATLSNGNVDIECDGNDITCRRLKIYGSTLHNNTGNFNLVCNGNTQSCLESYILCPYNGNCIIFCDSQTSCKNSEIIGPNTGELTIECNDIKSCINSIFDGSKSYTLNIKGCIEYNSCLDISLSCPPHTNQKNCFLEGNDNLGQYIYNQSIQIITNDGYIDEDDHMLNNNNNNNNINIGKGVIIYAKYGWNDININYKGTFGIKHFGKMICGNNYDFICNISYNKWSCINENEVCNDIELINHTQININTTYYNDSKKNGEENYKKRFIVKLIIVIISCLILLLSCMCIAYVQSRHNYIDHIEGDGEHILKQIHEMDNGYQQDCENKYDSE